MRPISRSATKRAFSERFGYADHACVWAAEERLKDAMERGASQEEIQKLMSELRQALNNYLQALRQQQGKNSKTAKSPNVSL